MSHAREVRIPALWALNLIFVSTWAYQSNSFPSQLFTYIETRFSTSLRSVSNLLEPILGVPLQQKKAIERYDFIVCWEYTRFARYSEGFRSRVISNSFLSAIFWTFT